MNYIVLDLEWNQSPSGKSGENAGLPFEIVEIGAVKLDADRRRIGEYHQYIAPTVYHELHHITQGILKISMKELKKGKTFAVAAVEFFDWCRDGGEYCFVTWGSMDLTELQRNCRFHEIEERFPQPFIYCDLQKMFSICYDDGKSRLSLEDATAQMEIPQGTMFHSAMNDADYTAQIMAKMDFEKVKAYTSVDTFYLPVDRKHEFTMHYPTYTKFVSKGYADRDKMMTDGVLLTSICPVCGKPIKKKVRWFAANPKSYYCVAECEEHGLIKGRIKVKKTDDERYYVMKIMKPTDAEGMEKIRAKQSSCRERRRERRHKEHQKASEANVPKEQKNQN